MPPLSCSGAFLSRLFYWSAVISLLKYRLCPPAHCSMASSHQCLRLFAEGSLWPPEPIKAMQGRLDVPKSLCPGSSPQPVTWEVVDKNPLPHSWVGILRRHVLHGSQFPSRSEPQLPTAVTCSKIYPVLAAFPSLFHVPTFLLPGITFQTNDLNSCLSVCFWWHPA